MKINTFFSVAAGVFFTLVLGIVTLGQGAFRFAYSQNIVLPYALLMGLALLALAALAWLRGKWRVGAAKPSRWGWFLAVYFPALLAVQLVVARSIWFYPGWDVLNVYRIAGLIAAGQPFGGTYFQLCPNNAPLTVLLVGPLWLAQKLGMAVPYAVLPYLGALMVNLSCLVCVLCVMKLTKSRFARIGALLLCTVWIAFSLTITVPYTDAFAIVFPVLALYVYLSGLRAVPKWFLISLVCFLGASIKPTVLIFELALVMLAVFRAVPFRGWSRARWRRTGAVVLALALGAVPGKLWQDSATAFLAGSPVPQGQLSETHYLMLGMNGETYGGHSPADVTFSTSFATLAQRRQANLQRAWERFSSRTVGQNVYFFTVKAYKAFSDGSLAANKSYLMEEKPLRTDALSGFLRQVFYGNGRYNPYFSTFSQFVWLGVLALCLLALFGRRRRSPVTAAIALTLMGVGCYLLLFEVWPRYLYLYTPLFVVLASLGLEGLKLPARRAKPLPQAEPPQPKAA